MDLFNFLLLLLGVSFFCLCVGVGGGGEERKLSVDGWNVSSDSLSFLFRVIIFLSLPVPLYYTEQKDSSDGTCVHVLYRGIIQSGHHEHMYSFCPIFHCSNPAGKACSPTPSPHLQAWAAIGLPLRVTAAKAPPTLSGSTTWTARALN